MRGSRRVLLLLLLLVVVLLLLVVVLVSLGGGGRALLGKRRRGESSSSSSGRRSSGGAAAVVAAVAAAAAAPAPSSAAGAVPPRRTAAQQDQVSRESVPVSDSDDVADADVAPGRGRERGAAENVDGAGVHLLGLSFLNLFFLFWGKGREILSGGDAEGAKGKKMRFISLSPAIVAPKKKRKETRSLSRARERRRRRKGNHLSVISLSGTTPSFSPLHSNIYHLPVLLRPPRVLERLLGQRRRDHQHERDDVCHGRDGRDGSEAEGGDEEEVEVGDAAELLVEALLMRCWVERGGGERKEG